MTDSDYEFTDDMREISGFGGDYEAACRAMVVAGVEWFDEHPDAEPKFKKLRGQTESGEEIRFHGGKFPDNDDAEALCDAMNEAAKAAGGGASGAMMEYCTNHVGFVREHGWDEYVELMEEDDA